MEHNVNGIKFYFKMLPYVPVLCVAWYALKCFMQFKIPTNPSDCKVYRFTIKRIYIYIYWVTLYK